MVVWLTKLVVLLLNNVYLHGDKFYPPSMFGVVISRSHEFLLFMSLGPMLTCTQTLSNISDSHTSNEGIIVVGLLMFPHEVGSKCILNEVGLLRPK